MAALGWAIVLSLPLYAAVQLWLVVRLGRRLERTDPGPARPDGWVAVSDGGRDTDARVCRVCGAENEPEYDYCGGCAARLPR